MATVTMPQLGESVTEGTIIEWLKQPGDPVKLDEPLCEIETEKVTAELPSPYEGTMGAIFVPKGETVDVGTVLCEVAEEGAPTEESPAETTGGGWSGGPMAIPPDESRAPAADVRSTVAPPRSAAPNGTPRRQPDTRERFYSPAVMRLASEHQLDLSTIHGTGIGGRVTRKDVEAHINGDAAAPAGTAVAKVPHDTREPAAPRSAGSAAYETIALSATRRTIAEHMVRSMAEAPQAWTMVEADVTGLVRLRERERERFVQVEGVELTLLPYFVEAVCGALREHPALNARWEGEELRRYHDLNLAIAVATEHGLVTPVLRNAGDLSAGGIAKAVADLAGRAQSRKLRIDDIEGGTFTVNNTGSFGSIASKPIVNHPQVAIVTMERAVKRAVVRDDDAIAVRWMMNVCLSFDHRALDGDEAGGFLAALKRRLEAVE